MNKKQMLHTLEARADDYRLSLQATAEMDISILRAISLIKRKTSNLSATCSKLAGMKQHSRIVEDSICVLRILSRIFVTRL